MRWALVIPAVALLGILATGCDEQSSSARADKSSTSALDQDTEYFHHAGGEELAHFRVRWVGKTVGKHTDAQGHIKVTKEYFKGVPVTAEFYVQPGAERLAIAQDTEGKVVALYFKNLRILGNHAEADVYGVAKNFGFRGPPGIRIGAGHIMSRLGTAEEPSPRQFLVGKAIESRTGGMSLSRHDGVMGPDYSVMTDHYYTVELVGITKLSDVLADNEALDNIIPAAAKEEAKRDTQPHSSAIAR